MLIQTIFNFISELEDIGNLKACDINLIQDIRENFNNRLPENELEKDDMVFLKQCFEERNNIITPDDYLLNPEMINEKWIQLAKEIEIYSKKLDSSIKKDYLHILMPSVINNVDYHNLSLLTETKKIGNFYLGESNDVLYRKRSFSEHLIKNRFYLSTCRVLNTHLVSAVGINELSRLKLASPNDSEFSIGSEKFNNFWDFLYKKVFPELKSINVFPEKILKELLVLIDLYFILKNKGDHFSSFKELFQNFCTMLYQEKIEHVNFFYGLEIIYNEQNTYLLECLILVNKSTSYTICESLVALRKGIYKLYPELNSLSELAENSIFNVIGIKEKKDVQLDACLQLVLSLMITEFEIPMLTSEEISVWDKKNKVFSDAHKIFKILEPCLVENQNDELAALHLMVKKEYISPVLATYCYKDTPIPNLQWYQLVESNALSTIGINWFQSEALIHIFLQLNIQEPSIASVINNFLDELIHTHAQKKTPIIKEFRVNIILCDLLKKLPDYNQKELIRLIKTYEMPNDANAFKSRCIDHIINQLTRIINMNEVKSNKFFTNSNWINSEKLKNYCLNFTNVCDIIDNLKNCSETPYLKLNSMINEQINDYLRSLSRPIFSIPEQKEAEDNARTLDYLGAFT